MYQFLSVLRIRTGFNAGSDPDLPFYLDSDTGPNPGSRTNADTDPVPGQTVKSQKVYWFLLNIINCD
jgi:hypothetical protein